MAAAFLPWEKWLGCLIHMLVIAVRRATYKLQRRRALSRSAGWPEIEGTIENILWDTSLPREEIAYTYSTESAVQTGYQSLWFESPNEPQPHVGDRIRLRYNERNAEESVFLTVVQNS